MGSSAGCRDGALDPCSEREGGWQDATIGLPRLVGVEPLWLVVGVRGGYDDVQLPIAGTLAVALSADEGRLAVLLDDDLHLTERL